jgi:hypothetical protein
MHRAVATTEKVQCTAFGRRDRRRCRLERRSGCLTCEVHKRYYETWHANHLLFDRYHMSKREREELEFQIQRGYVRIPEEWAARLYTYGEREWYQFLLDHTDIHPLVNVSCFEHIVYAELFHNWSSRDYSKMNKYIGHPESAVYVFRMILHWSSLMSHHGFYSFLDLMKTYFEKLDWRSILFSTGCLAEFESALDDLRAAFPDFKGGWDVMDSEHPIARFLKKFHKKTADKVRLRCSIYKEELMAAAWAPRRIQRWLDMGYDLDLLDAL